MLNFLILDDLIKLALKEDLGHGDITTEAISKFLGNGEYYFLAKDNFILCGTEIVKRVFWHLNQDIDVEFVKKDGDFVKKGEKFGFVRGDSKYILSGERVSLNFLQRLSAIATETNKYVKKLEGSKIKILDTRKTTPGHRILEKYAVKTGGGSNHRFGLFDGVMLKDNHIDAAGGIKNAVETVRSKIPSTIKIEVETRNLKEVAEAAGAEVDIIMLDNFEVGDIPKAREIAGKKIKLEVSGGVSLKNIDSYKDYDIDYISVGSLTHGIKSVDISLKYGGRYENK